MPHANDRGRVPAPSAFEGDISEERVTGCAFTTNQQRPRHGSDTAARWAGPPEMRIALSLGLGNGPGSPIAVDFHGGDDCTGRRGSKFRGTCQERHFPAAQGSRQRGVCWGTAPADCPLGPRLSAVEQMAAAAESEKLRGSRLRPQEAGAPSAARSSATRTDRVSGGPPVSLAGVHCKDRRRGRHRRGEKSSR
jgi:hypothetical protein